MTRKRYYAADFYLNGINIVTLLAVIKISKRRVLQKEKKSGYANFHAAHSNSKITQKKERRIMFCLKTLIL